MKKRWPGWAGGLLLLFLFCLLLPGDSLAHGPVGDQEDTHVFHVSSKGDIQTDLVFNPEPVTVGRPTDLSLRFRQGDHLVGPAKVAVQIELVEDALPVFEGDFWSDDGALSFSLNFVDGSEHTMRLQVRPAETSRASFVPFEAQFPFTVTPLSPPFRVMATSLSLFLGIVTVGLMLGLWGGRRWFGGRP